MTIQADKLIQKQKLLQIVNDGASVPYTKVQYLQSSGSQYINTEVIANENTVITFTGFCALKYSTWGVFAGVCDQNLGSNQTPWMFRWPNVSAKIGILTGRDDNSSANNYLNFSVQYSANEIIDKIRFSRNFIESDKTVTKGSDPQPFSPSQYPLFLFGCDQKGALWRGTSMRLQSCKIEEDGEVLRDFVAVKDNGVGYMYDTVSKQLFGNSGSGSFILGPDKNKEKEQ